MENGHGRLQRMHEEVEDVRVIMLDNLDKAEQRDVGLKELENRSTELQEKSKVFVKTAGQVKQKTRWENRKYKILGIVVAVIAVVIIIIIVLSQVLPSSNSTQGNSMQDTSG
ncbi:vesicle-associated membrane protein 5 [Brachyhypopomus gauderio]|uniref:vesicle-associated membrane protein 5 n=1 Tax=Brachyhypopomus gauderio TaxID=698409 RepID=UPI00404346E7